MLASFRTCEKFLHIVCSKTMNVKTCEVQKKAVTTNKDESQEHKFQAMRECGWVLQGGN